MEYVINYFYFFSLSIGVLYAFLLLFYGIGWIKIKPYQGKSIDFNTRVSVIIAARNEEHSITECLNHILAQDYPHNLFEIIVVDDDSADTTVKKVEALQQQHMQIHLIRLMDKEGIIAYKKRAIAKGIHQATGSLIVTTDADCRMGKQWLSTLVSFYEAEHPKMIVAPVCLDRESTLFEKLQSLEFLGLMLATGASVYSNKPLMCNGANLAYEKQAFEAVNGFEEIDTIASGDDVLLMLKIINKYPGGVKYLKSKAAIVQTNAISSPKGFIQQRKRWASKSFISKSKWISAVSTLVFAANFLLLLTLFISVFSHRFAYLFLLLLGIKSVADIWVLSLAASFFNKKNLLGLMLPVQLFYMFYVVIVGVSGNSGKYEWKGRTLDNALL